MGECLFSSANNGKKIRNGTDVSDKNCQLSKSRCFDCGAISLPSISYDIRCLGVEINEKRHYI